MKVVIRKEAFALMVGDSVGYYKKETGGYLYGTRINSTFKIEHIQPGQIIERKFKEVTFKPESHETFRLASLEQILKYNIVGDYHSHTDFKGEYPRPEPSEDFDIYGDSDIRDMLKNLDYVYLILALREKKRTQPWIRRADTILCGTIENIHIEVAAYVFNKEKEKFELCDIVCRGLLNRRFD